MGETLSSRAGEIRSIESRHSWIIAAASLTMLSFAAGAPLTVVVGLVPITETLGAGRSLPSLATSLAYLGTGVGGVFCGLMAGRFGQRAVAMLGGFPRHRHRKNGREIVGRGIAERLANAEGEHHTTDRWCRGTGRDSSHVIRSLSRLQGRRSTPMGGRSVAKTPVSGRASSTRRVSCIWDLTAVAALDRVVLKFRREGTEVEILGMNKASATLVDKLAIHDKPGASDAPVGH